MKTILNFFILIILLLFNVPSFSQHSLGFYGTVNYGSLYPDYKNVDFNPDYGGGFGVLYYRKMKPKINLVAQVGLEKVEWDSNYFELVPHQDSYWRRSSLNIFLGVNYLFIDNPYFRLGFTFLPRLGYVYCQRNLPGIDPQNLAAFREIHSRFLFGIDSKIDLQFIVSEKLSIHFRPGVSSTYFEMESNIQGLLQVDVGVSRSF